MLKVALRPSQNRRPNGLKFCNAITIFRRVYGWLLINVENTFIKCSKIPLNKQVKNVFFTIIKMEDNCGYYSLPQDPIKIRFLDKMKAFKEPSSLY